MPIEPQTPTPAQPQPHTPTRTQSPTGEPRSLWNRGFVALLITQFLVTFNDNLYRWLIVPIGINCVGWNQDGWDDVIRSLGGVTLLLPFLVFASTAGYCTDRFSKRSVIICVKILEIIAVLIGIGAILSQHVGGMLLVLAFLGIQGAFFSPCKYGSLPELVPHEKLTGANGVIALTTMMAAIFGASLGGLLFDLTTRFEFPVDPATGIIGTKAIVGTGGTVNSWMWITALLTIAVGGFLSSLFITKIKASDPDAKFPWNPVSQTWKDILALYKLKPLFIAALGSAFFWGLGALAQINIDKYGETILRISQTHTMLLLAVLSLGIGIGSVLAGYWSKHRIELGLVPVGAFGIAVAAVFLGCTPVSSTVSRSVTILIPEFPFIAPGYLYAALALGFLGICAGIYDIPMAAFLQDQAPAENRGRILAAVNFFSFSFMLFFSGGLFPVLALKELAFRFHPAQWFGEGSGSGEGIAIPPVELVVPGFNLSSNGVWMVSAVLVLLVFLMLTIHFLPQLIGLVANLIFILFYRRRVVGLENVPKEGPILFVGNHVSYLDGFMLYTALAREPRFFAHADYVRHPLVSYLADRVRVIRVLPGKKVVESLKEARKTLREGGSLVIFAEGGITRTGAIRHFEPGFLAFLKGNENVPIVPFYIGGLFGSMFSYAHGGHMTLRPRHLTESVVMAFGKPIRGPIRDPQQVQQVVEELGVDTMREYNRKPLPIPQRIMIRRCKQKGRGLILADSLGITLSGYKYLAGALVARHLLRENVLGPEDRNVGTLVPMSVGGMITNAALALDGRAVVNLNMTFGADTLNYCIGKADISHVLTSRRILERFPDLKLNARVVCMEDLLPKAPKLQRLLTYLRVILTPSWILERQIGLHRIKKEDDLAIIFTSGSTGRPKGVQLTHENVGECARAFFDTVGIKPHEKMLGILPFFHAFGYVGNFWMVGLSGCAGILHYNPLEAKTIGELAKKYKCDFIPCTPTFLRNYLRRPKEDFANVETVLTGAEKLPIDLIEAWEAKFGHRPSEGYGTTELSPCAAVNLPLDRQRGTYHPYLRDGSIGQPLPNIAMKVVDIETGADLPTDGIGMIVVKGPIVMKGYYKDPEKTAEVIRDGWYWTGDVGRRDAQGFVIITGRQSRISKIGGEMIPHVMIEEKIGRIVAASARDGDAVAEPVAESVAVAVTALPDPVKGERIVVLHRKLPIAPADIRAAMLAEGFPHLWIPGANAFREVEAIPLLGTGKLDLQGVKNLAVRLFADGQ